MLFEEVSTVTLTRETTCFSGAKSAFASVGEMGKFIISRLATENHSVSLSHEESTGEFLVSTSHLPRIILGEAKSGVLRGERTCLAHSCLMKGSKSTVFKSTDDESNPPSFEGRADGLVAPSVELRSSHSWEAFALRSRPKGIGQQSTSQRRQYETDTGGNLESKRQQDHPVSSVVKKPDSHRRQGSVSTVGTAVCASSDSKTSQSIKGEGSSKIEVVKNPEAYLVIRQYCVREKKSHPHQQTDEQDIFAIPLAYKPLALHVASIALVNNVERSFVAVFVASADDMNLRLYVHSIDGMSNQQSFLEVTSDETQLGTSTNESGSFLSALSLSSSIMAIDTLKVHEQSKKTTYNYLAVGCQDGSIHIVTYIAHARSDPKEIPFSLSLVDTTAFLVDGPVVSVQLNKGEKGILLSCGSLCGFACVFRQMGGAGSTFQGPYVVVEDLWDGRLDSEDSVFSVHHFQFGETVSSAGIAVGTRSGRLLVLEPHIKRKDESAIRYRLFWSCQLPYPIYGICSTDAKGGGMVGLIVTTRKTVHVFRAEDGIVSAFRERLSNTMANMKF